MPICVRVIPNRVVAGKRGSHKGRMRTYTSPEEIDAQMKAEKERKKVGCVHIKGCSKYGQVFTKVDLQCFSFYSINSQEKGKNKTEAEIGLTMLQPKILKERFASNKVVLYDQSWGQTVSCCGV